MRGVGVVVAVVAATTLPAGFASAGSAHPAPAAAPPPMVAPYLDMGAQHPANLYTAIRNDGLRDFSAGFVIARGCTPTWDDGVAVAADPAVTHIVTKAQSLGARAIVSFGGEGGEDPARTCTNPKRILAAYRSVINDLHVRYVDFDIEGDALAEPTSIQARFVAIAELEKQRPKLVVSVTIPVLPDGLDRKGKSLLRVAKQVGARIDLVNIMTMDYGGGAINMGAAAVSAAKATVRQIRKLWPADTYRNLGITPMIGRNDDVHETFRLADARQVVRFARARGVGRLAFWALDRDNRCAHPSPQVSNNCSSLAQQPLAFTHAFLR